MFSQLHEFIRSYDWVLIAIVFLLCSVGFAALYSVDLSRNMTQLVYVPVQFLAFLLGLAVLFVGGAFHTTVYQAFVRVAYIAAAGLLVAVLLVGRTIRGTSGWFRFGGLSFQPSEFAKVALIFALAYFVSRVGRRFDRIQYVIASGAMTIPLAALIIIQPNLGTGIILIGIWSSFLLLTGVKKMHILLLASLGIFCALAGWFFLLKPYQKDRVLTFLEPGRDPLGAGYHVTQSKIAIGAGKLFGRGLGFGSQSQLRFLPEAHTDFIFSVIGEELGFLGTVITLALYGLLLWRFTTIGYRSRNDFSAYAVFGIATLFFIQVVFNVGAASGLLPVTGVTLPFVSYGGSSLLINFFLIGFVESVHRSNGFSHEIAMGS